MTATAVVNGVQVGNRSLVATATSVTVDRNQSGTVFYATAVDLVFTLPDVEAGLSFEFVAGIASSSTGLSVSPQSGDQIRGLGITAANGKDLINTAATDAIGDRVTITADETGTAWYVESHIGTWAREA